MQTRATERSPIGSIFTLARRSTVDPVCNGATFRFNNRDVRISPPMTTIRTDPLEMRWSCSIDDSLKDISKYLDKLVGNVCEDPIVTLWKPEDRDGAVCVIVPRTIEVAEKILGHWTFNVYLESERPMYTYNWNTRFSRASKAKSAGESGSSSDVLQELALRRSEDMAARAADRRDMEANVNKMGQVNDQCFEAQNNMMLKLTTNIADLVVGMRLQSEQVTQQLRLHSEQPDQRFFDMLQRLPIQGTITAPPSGAPLQGAISSPPSSALPQNDVTILPSAAQDNPSDGVPPASSRGNRASDAPRSGVTKRNQSSARAVAKTA